MNNKDIKSLIAGKEFPSELSFDQFDNMDWESKQFGLNDSRHNSKIANDVLKYAKKVNGQIYTQVDGDTDRVYSKGLRYVNRTGIYEVVVKDGFRVDNS